MRVAFLTPGFSASEDDWCIPALLDLVRGLVEVGVDVTVFTLRYPHHRRPYKVHGAQVIPFGAADARRFDRVPLFLRVLREIRRQAKARPFDVIHGFWAHEPGFLAALAGKLTATPSVTSILGGELIDLPDIDYGGQLSAANRFLVRRSLAWADLVVVGSEFQHGLAAPHVESERLVVQPLGVDTRLFRPGVVSEGTVRLEGDPKLIHVASLCPVKDQTTLLRAFAVLTAKIPTAALHIVGDGELRVALERLAADLDVTSRVQFHGEQRHEHLPDFYRQADLAVLSSRSENSALVVLEAAACGCPTVGTAVGSLTDLGEGSRTVPAGDHQALGELLVDVLMSPNAIADMARQGLERVELHLNLETTVARWQDLYDAINRD